MVHVRATSPTQPTAVLNIVPFPFMLPYQDLYPRRVDTGLPYPSLYRLRIGFALWAHVEETRDSQTEST